MDKTPRRILVEGGRATGVETEQGEIISADAVVMNGDAGALRAGLLGAPAIAALNSAPRAQPSLSAVTFAMRARTRGFPLVHHNVFFSRDYRAEFDDIFRDRRLPRAPTVYVCAQDRGDEDVRSSDERLFALVNAPAVDGAGELSTEELRQCEERTFRFLADCGLDIQAPPQAIARTTPKDFAQLFPATGGAIYGQASHGWMASFTRPGSRTQASGSISRGRQRASGPGRADGGDLGSSRCEESDGGPCFDAAVAPSGYRWWYVDALSDDGEYGVTVIAFIGSVFSPYYAWSGWADPFNHCAVNVALYGPRGARWAMTERGRQSLKRTRDVLLIGPSSLEWRDGALTIRVNEIAAPLPKPIRGEIVVKPLAINAKEFTLETKGNHIWRPIAPVARVSLDLRCARPALERPRLFRHERRRRAARKGLCFLDMVARQYRRRRRNSLRRRATPGGSAVARLAIQRIGRDGDARPSAPRAAAFDEMARPTPHARR